MTATEWKRQKVTLAKRLAKEFAGRFWQWRGSEFMNFGFEGVEGYTARYEFHMKFYTVKAVIETEEQYGIPDSVRVFTGPDAIEECVDWTAEKLLDVYEELKERTAPFAAAHEAFKRAMQGRTAR